MTLKQEYDLIFSMGGSCASSTQLRSKGLQTHSLPFDWVFHREENHIEALIYCFETDFRNWMNKDNMVELREGERGNSELFQYKDIITSFRFIHDFHKPISDKKEYEFVVEKYKRRILRLKKFIEKSKNILLINDTKMPVKQDALKKLIYVLNKKYPHKNFDIYINHFTAEEDEFLYDKNIIICNRKRDYLPADYWGDIQEWDFLKKLKIIISEKKSRLNKIKLFFSNIITLSISNKVFCLFLFQFLPNVLRLKIRFIGVNFDVSLGKIKKIREAK